MRMRKVAEIGFGILGFCCLIYFILNFWNKTDFQDDRTPRDTFFTRISVNGAKSATGPAAPTSPYASCPSGTAGSVLTSSTGGRLGNQLYMYATMYAELEKTKGQRSGLLNPEMYQIISKTFNISLPVAEPEIYNNVSWNVYDIDNTLGNTYPIEIALPTEPACIQIRGFPQQWQLFDSFRSTILHEFTFHDRITVKARQILSTAKQTFFKEGSEVNVTFIGVHVRRTDYVEHSKYLRFYLPENSFYQGAMKYMAEKYENPIFVIASDDIAYCKKEFKILESSYKIFYSTDEKNYKSDDNAGIDLATLSNCDHLIFGVGTFGFWAGYLCSGDVVYCECAKNDSRMWETQKFFLPSWTGLNMSGEITRTKIIRS